MTCNGSNLRMKFWRGFHHLQRTNWCYTEIWVRRWDAAFVQTAEDYTKKNSGFWCIQSLFYEISQKKEFLAFETIQAYGTFHRVQVSHLSAERGAWGVEELHPKAENTYTQTNKKRLWEVEGKWLNYLVKIYWDMKCKSLYLCVMWLPSRKWNAWNSIQRLQQKTEWIVIDNNNSAWIPWYAGEILHMLSILPVI